MFYSDFLEEKQKSDVEEDGDTVSHEEDDGKPKAEVMEGSSGKAHVRRELHKIVFSGSDSKESVIANFVKVALTVKSLLYPIL